MALAPTRVTVFARLEGAPCLFVGREELAVDGKLLRLQRVAE